MKVKTLRLAIEELENKVNTSEAIKDNSKQGVLVKFISASKSFLDMLSTAKKDDKKFKELVDEAQSIISDLKDYAYDLSNKIDELNKFLDDSISTSELDDAISNIEDEVDYCEMKELDEEELDELLVDEALEMVKGDYNE